MILFPDEETLLGFFFLYIYINIILTASGAQAISAPQYKQAYESLDDLPNFTTSFCIWVVDDTDLSLDFVHSPMPKSMRTTQIFIWLIARCIWLYRKRRFGPLNHFDTLATLAWWSTLSPAEILRTSFWTLMTLIGFWNFFSKAIEKRGCRDVVVETDSRWSSAKWAMEKLVWVSWMGIKNIGILGEMGSGRNELVGIGKMGIKGTWCREMNIVGMKIENWVRWRWLCA